MPDWQHVEFSLQQKYVPSCGGRGGTVTVPTRPQDARPSNRGSILNKTKKFISSQSIQTGSGVCADFYSICVGLDPQGSRAVPIFQMTTAVPPPSYMS